MTPLEFVASLEHGEAKAAALTVYNLMTPVWVEITDDPATLPPMGQTVIIREGCGNDFERFGYRDANHPSGWRWYHSRLAYWSGCNQSVEPDSCDGSRSPTHWRPI